MLQQYGSMLVQQERNLHQYLLELIFGSDFLFPELLVRKFAFLLSTER